MKRMLVPVVLLLALMLCGCQKKVSYEDIPYPIATITMEDGSIMRFKLDLDMAPNTVINFAKLANKGFYDGLTFFRIVPGALIESGSPTNDGRGNAGYTIRGEFPANGWSQNKLSHMRGTISMALQGHDKDSGSCIFFIMQGNYPEYDDKYAPFGTAFDDATLATIDRIGSTPVDGEYAPYSPPRISTIRVDVGEYEMEPETLSIASDKNKRKVITKQSVKYTGKDEAKQE